MNALATPTLSPDRPTLSAGLRLVHPLDDAPETKVNVDALGPMRLTPRARWALIALRAYLVAMTALVVFRVVVMA
jgi:hypothetical protein